MPEPLTTYNTELWVAYNTLSASMNNWRNEFYNLGTQIAAQNWAAAETSCIALGDNYSSMVRADLCDSGGVKGKTYQSLDWIDDNWELAGDGYELTMAKIMDAVWDSTPLETFFFVNYVDAMRAAIWNKEISAEKLRELYRHFLI